MTNKGLLDEDTYDRERSDELDWIDARSGRTTRRSLIKLFAHSIGGAASLGVPFLRGGSVSAQTMAEIVKPAPKELFLKNGPNLEMRWDAMYDRGYIVPVDGFFVRNNSALVPRPDVRTWRLKIEGNGVSRPHSFTHDELVAMPSVSVIRAIECAGNGRNFFEQSHGKKIPGTPWFLGGIGVAEWTGVPLRNVLDLCGVKRTAKDVMPEGLDEKNVKRPMSIEKALEPDTLLVYAMNGQPLPPDHGFPIRMLVPGWVGIASIKWVGSIQVSEQPLYSEYNTKKYVLIGDDFKPAPPALGPMITTQKVKSAFELPWNGEISVGKHLIRGRSWSGEGNIKKVVVSFDDGRTWQPARMREPNIEKAWVRWDVDWEPKPGKYQLKVRATDSAGNTQPDKMPLNEEGYVHWAVVTHNITVK